MFFPEPASGEAMNPARIGGGNFGRWNSSNAIDNSLGALSNAACADLRFI
jgi:hypothetical protein